MPVNGHRLPAILKHDRQQRVRAAFALPPITPSNHQTGICPLGLVEFLPWKMDGWRREYPLASYLVSNGFINPPTLIR